MPAAAARGKGAGRNDVRLRASWPARPQPHGAAPQPHADPHGSGPHPAEGVRADRRIRLRADGRTIQEDAGEVQFTETAFPARLRSRFRGQRDRRRGPGCCSSCGSIPRRRCGRFCRHGAKRSRRWRARSCFPVCSIRASARRSAMPAASARSRLRPVPTRRWKRWYLLSKSFSLPVTGVSGFESAQVTAGGVRTAEFRADTLESRLAPACSPAARCWTSTATAAATTSNGPGRPAS